VAKARIRRVLPWRPRKAQQHNDCLSAAGLIGLQCRLGSGSSVLVVTSQNGPQLSRPIFYIVDIVRTLVAANLEWKPHGLLGDIVTMLVK
jgi:hypothetical protein